MDSTSISLREMAVNAYQHILAEKSRDARLYSQLSLRDALQLRLWKAFGAERIIEIEEGDDEQVVGAVVEGLNFLGMRTRDGYVQLILVESCAYCGNRMTSRSLTDIIDLGQELSMLETSGILSNHDCPRRSTNRG